MKEVSTTILQAAAKQVFLRLAFEDRITATVGNAVSMMITLLITRTSTWSLMVIETKMR